MRAQLHTLGTLNQGFQLRTAIEPTDEGRYALVRLGDVSEGGLDDLGLPRMDLDLDEARFQIEPGDVLCRSRSGNYRAGLVGELRRPTVALSPLYIYRADRTRILPEYAAWWINIPEAQVALEAAAIGSNIKTVPIHAFATLDIPVVPLELQRQIVNVDALNRKERALEHELAEKRAAYIENLLADTVRGSMKGQKR